jgi:hypothetical protein
MIAMNENVWILLSEENQFEWQQTNEIIQIAAI